MSYIIAVSGTTGAGKSTLTRELAKQLDASIMYFDAYQATTQYPPDMMEKLVQGETVDIQQVKCPDFYHDLLDLKSGNKIVDPRGREILPTNYIVVEEPYGRLREGMDLLDLVAFIQIPLDVSLARRVLRDIQIEYKSSTSDQAMAKITEFLTIYLGGLRNGYDQMTRMAVKSADIVLDGMKETGELAREVLAQIETKR